jgi:hypothetical protein
MSQLNKSLQGPGEIFFTSSEKVLGFKTKLNFWKNHGLRGNLEKLPLLLGLESEEGYQQVFSLVENHPEELRNKIKHYFPSFSIQVYGGVRNPCSELTAQPENLAS